MRLTEELILLILDEKTGYLGMVPDWDFSCVMAGAVIADLSLQNRVDVDLESLNLLDATPTGDPLLDPTLEEISQSEETRSMQYWIEKNTPRSDDIVEITLERLAEKGILETDVGGFWTMTKLVSREKAYPVSDEGSGQEAKSRIMDIVLHDTIPDPRDIILICLMHICNGFKILLSEDDYLEKLERVKALSRMDLVGIAIAQAVEQSMIEPKSKRIIKTKPIPRVKVSDILKIPGLLKGNVPRIVHEIYKKYGPVAEMPVKMSGERVLMLMGLEANQWLHKNGRFYLRSKDYIKDFESALGASRTLPGMDGAEHFRLRKLLRPAYSRATLANHLPELIQHCQTSLREWEQGSVDMAIAMTQRLFSRQVSQLMIGIDCSEYANELLAYEHRALNVYVARAMPKFMMNTPRMKRAKRFVAKLVDDIRSSHTRALREGKQPDLADTLLEIHRDDPQFLPETDITFPFVASMVASIYLGSGLAFALFAIVSHPELYGRVREEADRLFSNGRDLTAEDFSPENANVAHRVFLETERMYPVIPWQLRTVMNRCMIGNHEIPSNTRVLCGHTATHYMDDLFKDPLKFDIDRFLPERAENRTLCAYVPFGLGTHTCLGHNWVALQMTVNLLLIARHVTLEMEPEDYELGINPFPSLAPDRKLKFRVAEVRGL